MRLKIVHSKHSTGRRADTKITNSDTGEMLEGVQSVEFTHSVNGEAIVKLEIIGCEVDIESDDPIFIPVK